MPVDPKEIAVLQQAIGDSVMAWGNVESRLNLIFHFIVQIGSPRVAHEIWTRLQGFDTHLLVTNDVLKGYADELLSKPENAGLKPLIEPLLNDWKLLFNRARRLAEQRNEIVHSAIVEKDGKVWLHPFYPERRDELDSSTIFQRAREFNELSDALRWFNGCFQYARSQHEAWTALAPDLVLRLRAESNRTRAKPKAPGQPSPQ